MEMNNELFVYVKKNPSFSISTRNQSLQAERAFMRVERKVFPFSASDMRVFESFLPASCTKSSQVRRRPRNQ